jgi:hypothetical protein
MNMSSSVAKYIETCQDDPLVEKLAEFPCSEDLYQDEEGEVFLVLDTVKVLGMAGNDSRVVIYVAMDGKWQLKVGKEKLFKAGENAKFVQVLPDYIRDEITNKPPIVISNQCKVFDVIRKVLAKTKPKMHQTKKTVETASSKSYSTGMNKNKSQQQQSQKTTEWLG